jgi:hypothetical protein
MRNRSWRGRRWYDRNSCSTGSRVRGERHRRGHQDSPGTGPAALLAAHLGAREPAIGATLPAEGARSDSSRNSRPDERDTEPTPPLKGPIPPEDPPLPQICKGLQGRSGRLKPAGCSALQGLVWNGIFENGCGKGDRRDRWIGMIAPDKCRVDGCARHAAATIVGENLPGPLRLCATHTEQFRQNSAAWNIIWERTAPEPTLVRAPDAAKVGRQMSRSDDELRSAGMTERPAGSWRLLRWRRRP